MKRPSGERNDGRFDAFRLAERGAVLSGRLDAVDLPRLGDALHDDADATGPIEWRIAGSHDAQGRPALNVAVEGSVPVVCQRCLASFAWPVAQHCELLLAHDEVELARLDADSEAEVLLADGPLDPVAVVEDELLLTLPYAPFHQGECPPA